MRISGYIKNSFVDYPGQIACVVFVPGCNMNCYFCHNKHLLGKEVDNIDNAEIFEFLQSRTGFIDAVVVTGGEPTIHDELEEFIIKVKSIGYLIKLDSNGFRPNVIKRLIEQDLLSYIAIDIKAPFNKYIQISDKDNDIDDLKETIKLLIDSGIDHEFRTTFLPDQTYEDIYEIASVIRGSKNYYLQQFRPLLDQKGIVDMRSIKKPHSKEYIFKTAENVKKILFDTNVSVRGVK